MLNNSNGLNNEVVNHFKRGEFHWVNSPLFDVLTTNFNITECTVLVTNKELIVKSKNYLHINIEKLVDGFKYCGFDLIPRYCFKDKDNFMKYYFSIESNLEYLC